jgi:hypothetical protein
MSSESIPSDSVHAASPQPEWEQQVGTWRDTLALCAGDPSRKHVHDLRGQTLRLRVAAEHQMQEQPQDATAVRAFKRWNKAGKKLRRALQPVRDADVQLAKLDGLREAVGKADGKAKLSSHCLREMDELEIWLKRQRQKSADKLVVAIEAQEKRLNRSSQEMESVLAPQMLSRKGSNASAAMRIFARLASDLPDLDRSNLHEYRKHLKAALYLAENSAAADPVAARLADIFRKIHNAAGEWHDWQTLAQKADRILPGRVRKGGLVPVLETLADVALQKAIDLCRSFAPRFPGNMTARGTDDAQNESDEQTARQG